LTKEKNVVITNLENIFFSYSVFNNITLNCSKVTLTTTFYYQWDFQNLPPIFFNSSACNSVVSNTPKNETAYIATHASQR